ncbi:lipid II-degrading bacteriocin [Curvibacter sp. HBC61]|uniref:Lipid II-degrading bacteriocin n=1 Tax=Curvibacter cyanobacteriorum TaxID=3026422 RepID=A0ABT5MVL7_9BURK|nr:lipid II-degrading bacteriocin [Curvibacter sp. HBC61]
MKVDATGLFSLSDVSDAWGHYCDGSGTDWSTSFSSLNWGDTEASISVKIKNLVGGSCKDATIPVEFTSEGQTGGADAWIVGRHSVKTKGAIQLSRDCTWKFSGDLSSARGYDPYDFDKSNRGFIAETATAVGRASCKTKAKSFKILITGSKAISLSGKVKG